MNKKKNPNEIRKLSLNIRLSRDELHVVRCKALEFGFSCPTSYGREMITNGFVYALPTQKSLVEIKELRKLIIETRSNFSRIANYMKYRDIRLVEEIKTTIQRLNEKIDTL